VFAIGRPMGGFPASRRPSQAATSRRPSPRWGRTVEQLGVRRRPPRRTSAWAAPRRRTACTQRRAALRLRCFRQHAAEGTKVAWVIPAGPLQPGRPGRLCPPGVGSTSRAPGRAAEASSQTDASKPKRGFCSTAARLQPPARGFWQWPGSPPRGAGPSRPWAAPWSPRCRSRTPGARRSPPRRVRGRLLPSHAGASSASTGTPTPSNGTPPAAASEACVSTTRGRAVPSM
jgi:hypothetical protein